MKSVNPCITAMIFVAVVAVAVDVQAREKETGRAGQLRRSPAGQ